mgnify:CR=1 FL=1
MGRHREVTTSLRIGTGCFGILCRFRFLRHQTDEVIVNINLLCGVLVTVLAALMNFNPLYKFPQDFRGQLLDVRIFLYDFQETFHIDDLFRMAFNFLLQLFHSGG